MSVGGSAGGQGDEDLTVVVDLEVVGAGLEDRLDSLTDTVDGLFTTERNSVQNTIGLQL